MNEAWIREFWAPTLASVIIVAVLLFVLHRAWLGSRRGRLGRLVAELRDTRREAARAASEADSAARRLGKLEKRTASVAPQKLDEARERLGDAERLCQIRSDQLKVSENRLRRLILEEYPPKRHETLLRRFKVPVHADTRPFTFDGGNGE